MSSYTRRENAIRRSIEVVAALLHTMTGTGLLVLLLITTKATNQSEQLTTPVLSDAVSTGKSPGQGGEDSGFEMASPTPWTEVTRWLDEPLTLPVILLVLWITTTICLVALLIVRRSAQKKASNA